MSSCRRARRDTAGPYHRAVGAVAHRGVMSDRWWRQLPWCMADEERTGLSLFDGVLIVGGGVIAVIVAIWLVSAVIAGSSGS